MAKLSKKAKIILIIVIILSAIGIASFLVIFLMNNKNNDDHNKKNNHPQAYQTMKLDYFNDAIKPTLKTHIIDVGQADAILLQMSPDGNFNNYSTTYNILIDSGNFRIEKTDDGFIHTPAFTTKNENKLKSYLNYYNLNKDLIDMFVFSHADADHVGAGDEVINAYAKPKESIVLNFANNDKSTSTYKNTLEAIKINNLKYVDPELDQAMKTESFIESGIIDNCELYDIDAGQKLVEFNENNWFSFLVPSIDYSDNKNEANESSINNYLLWNGYRFLFAGDSEGKTHDDLLNVLRNNKEYSSNRNIFPIHFYKVAHHGSVTQNSNNSTFLKSILDADSKMLISHNDNKLFQGTATFNEGFMNNLIATGINFNNPSIYSTQDVGDIVITIQSTTKIETFDRNRQDNMKLWSNDIFTTNKSKNSQNYKNYFY